MKKKDITFLAVVFIGLAGIAAGFYLTHQDTGASVEVTVDGAIYGTYPLEKDQTIEVTEGEFHNVIRIEGGQAYMEEADCPDGYCKRQGTISRVNETIVCLPHKLVAEVESDGSTTDDADDAPDVIVK